MTAPSGEVSRFRPRFPWWGADLQTLRDTLLRDRADLAPWPGERLTFRAENGDALNGVLHTQEAGGAPLVVLVHGLTGCEDSSYVRASARHLLVSGRDVFRLNLRGAAPSRSSCREMYHAGRSADLALVFGELAARGHAARGLHAVGYSLGGNILLKYLAEAGKGAAVSRAVAVSVPLDLSAVARRLRHPRNRAYHDWLLARMKTDWRGGPLDIGPEQRTALDSARSIRAFDDTVVAPANGFDGAEDYYTRNASGPMLHRIETPTLVLNADNDPWIPIESCRRFEKGLPPNVELRVSRGGGHVGFHGRGGRWHDLCAAAFLSG